MLSSRPFRKGGQHAQFLKFVVESEATGSGESLKEAAIAVECFGCSATATKDETQFVRAVAGKVRAKLAEFYQADDGQKWDLRIDIPRNQYRPEFRWSMSSPAMVRKPGLRRLLDGYLSDLVKRCSELPRYFPSHFQKEEGFDGIRQSVEVVIEPRGFDRWRSDEKERLRAAGLDVNDYLPHRSRPEFKSLSEDFGQREAAPEILDWGLTREPHNEKDRERFRHTIVLGDPGFGKTWLLRHEAIRLARLAQNSMDEGAHPSALAEIPIYLRLTDVDSALSTEKGLRQAVCTCLEIADLERPLIDWFATLFRSNRITLLLGCVGRSQGR